MTQPSKFTSALANLTPRTKTPPSKPDSEHAVPHPVIAIQERSKGRPPGKRSDPDFQPTTVLLRSNTKRAANRLLEDRGEKKDLSDLIEELLSNWIDENT